MDVCHAVATATYAPRYGNKKCLELKRCDTNYVENFIIINIKLTISLKALVSVYWVIIEYRSCYQNAIHVSYVDLKYNSKNH